MDPGDYKLKIYATNDNYSFTSNVIERNIYVRPKFYETWWFKTGSVASLLFSIGMFSYWRSRNLRKKAVEKLRIEKDYALIELQALQSQLNPHFVFNCLNSIHSLINEGRSQEANEYLTKFSKLLRKFLEQSSTHLTTLGEELEINELYLSLEKLRFKDKLSYEIKISENVIDLDIEIPSVIIQPIVENSIRHGIFHKEKGGNVVVNVDLFNNNLLIDIIDDGVGIAETQKLKSPDHHQGKAVSLLNRKKALLNIVEGMEVKINFHDMEPGTKVSLIIPVKEE